MCFLFLFCVAVFAVSFVCSGKKSGEVDMTFKLNYTGVESGLIDTEDVKTFMMVIRRECNKTGMCLQCSLLFVACNQCIDGNFAYKMDSKWTPKHELSLSLLRSLGAPRGMKTGLSYHEA